MAYEVKYSTNFKKALKRCQKRGLDIEKLNAVLTYIANHGVAPEKTKPHPLKGNYKGYMECHIEPDWLLVWKVYRKQLILMITDTGTHAELLKK